MNSELKNFLSNFGQKSESKFLTLGNYPYGACVKLEHVRSLGHQSFYLDLCMPSTFSLFPFLVNPSLKVGFIDRDFGNRASYNACQISVVRSVYADDRFLSRVATSLCLSEDDTRGSRLKIPHGSDPKPLLVYFGVERFDLQRVKIVSLARISDDIFFSEVSTPLPVAEAKSHIISSFDLIVSRMIENQGYFSQNGNSAVGSNGEPPLFDGATKL